MERLIPHRRCACGKWEEAALLLPLVLCIYPTPFITTRGGVYLHLACCKSANISFLGPVLPLWSCADWAGGWLFALAACGMWVRLFPAPQAPAVGRCLPPDVHLVPDVQDQPYGGRAALGSCRSWAPWR